MADSHAETGDVAAKAGASTGGHATNAEADAATAKAGAVGAADVAGPEAPKPDANAPKTDAKAKETTKKVVDATKKLVDTVLDEAAKSESVGETKKIKMERSHPDFAYHAGEEGDLPTEKADFLIAGGFAKAVGTEEADETED